ncbi:hypothetical protein KC343_g820 [Hortaea werneckii]|nr:hypothetical protein KC352_g4837 [Hortaea werneckii]KAI7572318.1 hypothetical protein KC317_g870 [Hortaea werneckii]KAI7627317.1 hypothetical protein KC346_g804 [Hortaea werneckii]KAI7637234.1 hypothetical protein KC343_g820 [Hortaea werneckii]KAI7682895.1 hypothetical protein KC319_g750 [Hortaea werneckii]
MWYFTITEDKERPGPPSESQGNEASTKVPYVSYPPPSLMEQSLDDNFGMCSDRFGTEYIRKFGKSLLNYCDNSAKAALKCFTHKAHDFRRDSFCIGHPIALNHTSISIDCTLRAWTSEDDAKQSARFQDFPYYWYNTGPRSVFDQHIQLGSSEILEHFGNVNQTTLLLVQREETVVNLWHTLMQVMSLWLTLEVLRTSVDETVTPTRPFLNWQEDIEAQIIILDDYDDGPFYEFWRMFGNGRPRRLHALDSEVSIYSKAVIPLPGGSNPMWEGDWTYLPCNESLLLRAFSQRILDSYTLPQTTQDPTPLTLTLINRSGTRRLRNQDALLVRLQATFPDIRVRSVDLAALSITDQLWTVHTTNILVGVHGAGLAHGMFLPNEGTTTLVEILPPELDFFGFANMCKLLGHKYFSEHGVHMDGQDMSGDWHFDDVSIEEERFLSLIQEAISEARKPSN